jgi:hypothetical protein
MANSYANDGIGQQHFAAFGTPVNPISTTIASAATLTPLSLITIVTGTVGVQNITLPWPGFEGSIILIYTDSSPAATQTGGTTGIAIALATTVVRYKQLEMTYSQITGLWYPSY